MRIDVVTIFPEMLQSASAYGVLGRAVKNNILELHTWNPRDYTAGERGQVDDRPYGGGPGMVMMIEPLQQAIQMAKKAQQAQNKSRFTTIYLSPQGRQLNQSAIEQFASLDGLILLSGRYKGVDERLLEMEVDEEWSLGDYVISGGELAAMVMIDAVARCQKGVLGNEDSVKHDSFSTGLLDCPHYTHPFEYAGMQVPTVLTEGKHEEIRRWQLKHALGRTLERRSDLLRKRKPTSEERHLLNEYAMERHLDSSLCFMEKDDD